MDLKPQGVSPIPWDFARLSCTAPPPLQLALLISAVSLTVHQEHVSQMVYGECRASSGHTLSDAPPGPPHNEVPLGYEQKVAGPLKASVSVREGACRACFFTCKALCPVGSRRGLVAGVVG